MDDISGSMRDLSEGIVAGHKERKNRIQELKDRAGTIRKDAASFLDETKRLHEEMGRELKSSLRESRAILLNDVNAMRDDFRKREKEVRADLAEAKRTWNAMKTILGGKPK